MISVIVPVYNVRFCLEECLESILGQSYADLEIILIDDGSTDGSGAVCDAYAARDERIRVIHQPNRGLSAARNAGLEIARGEYISFVDSDDYLLPDALETLLSLCLTHHAEFSLCAHDKLTPDGRRRPWKPALAGDTFRIISGPAKMKAYVAESSIPSAVWGKLYARELFREIRFPAGKLYEDLIVTYRLVHAASRIAISGSCGYVYRIRPGSIVNSSFDPRHADRVHHSMEQLRFIEAHYPALVPDMRCQLVYQSLLLIRQMGASRTFDRETMRLIQPIFRKYALQYLRSGHSIKKRIHALIAAVHVAAAIALAAVFAHRSLRTVCGSSARH